jgi:adenosylcobyric acid synthase
MSRALMILGTASHVGKSLLAAAFARWLHERGLRVAPFKAQNMSLNSYVTLAGKEIARSQVTQAEAVGLEPTADMNPILLKPLEYGSQVIVQGHAVGVMSIQEYYAYKPKAWEAITASYRRLSAAYDAIVLEGAGSPAEINLKDNDLVNMRMAELADAAVVLVADIERGGVFAQLIGTWELLEPKDRERIVGFVINKFRGDARLLDSGLDFIQQRTGRPVLGVLPYDTAMQLDEEDSLGLPEQPAPLAGGEGEIDIAIVRLPGISNFTDFAALARAPSVSVRYVSGPAELHWPDLLILPGTRTTLRALGWLQATGLADAIHRLAADSNGPYILGVCGGCQILGKAIHDPDRVEADVAFAEGLGLLDLETHFEAGKLLARVEAEAIHPDGLCHGCPIIGYEVHQGHSRRCNGAAAWLRIRRQPGGEVGEDGAVRADGRVCGSYVHGLFDDARFCRALIAELRRKRGLSPLADDQWPSQRAFWAGRYRRLAGWLTEYCDLAPVGRVLQLPG